jgi:hypothetical protein
MKKFKLAQALVLAGGVLGSVGFLGTAEAATITNGTLTLDVNATGSIHDVTNAAGGFWNYGYPTIGFGISSSAGFGREDANVGAGSFAGATVGGATTIVATGSWGGVELHPYLLTEWIRRQYQHLDHQCWYGFRNLQVV